MSTSPDPKPLAPPVPAVATPPDSGSELPSPTSTTPKFQRPSRAALRCLRLIRALKNGRPVEFGSWHKEWLRPGQFGELVRLLERDERLKGYWEDKVRYDYDPSLNIFILRMPTSVLHEYFSTSVTTRIRSELQNLASKYRSSNSKLSCLIADIEQTGTPEIALDEPSSSPESSQEQSSDAKIRRVTKRSADAVFIHPAGDSHTAVVEIAYSQKRKDLPYLADSYITGSRGEIRVVIGLDIEYNTQKGKEATVSVWRPAIGVNENGEKYGYCEQAIKAQLFRAPKDFVPEKALRDVDEETVREAKIVIPFVDLRKYLDKAEDWHRRLAGKSRRAEEGTEQIKWKKRKRSPEEELDNERERKFAAEEEEWSRRYDEEDGEFVVRQAAVGSRMDGADDEAVTYDDGATTAFTQRTHECFRSFLLLLLLFGGGDQAEAVADKLLPVARIPSLALRILQAHHRPLVDLILLRAPQPAPRLMGERRQPGNAPLDQRVHHLDGPLQLPLVLVGQPDRVREDYDGFLRLLSFQSGHKPLTHTGTYALEHEFPAKLQPDLIDRYLENSRMWHQFALIGDSDVINVATDCNLNHPSQSYEALGYNPDRLRTPTPDRIVDTVIIGENDSDTDNKAEDDGLPALKFTSKETSGGRSRSGNQAWREKIYESKRWSSSCNPTLKRINQMQQELDELLRARERAKRRKIQ
ncbi:hypothetical protein H2199_009190 [Coniosporium tulheliwenetii]|uniref:Uncharacterized protein n=1 Tax=Coniosporium tulheliwenetii TaxID=3383036 RepID=A0ACC2YFE7_9PEZI|nr:hypothetical protein H2199_009190 [Cladosporium sp. JES 115]